MYLVRIGMQMHHVLRMVSSLAPRIPCAGLLVVNAPTAFPTFLSCAFRTDKRMQKALDDYC